ncbi:hypothetical protein BT67DRAFT_290186 [Trichocladium antarcticum]|uniref:Uncharacterized protein n=1 Tax=Trichocladium antarcticum TaxID=1450529 RepID=A0AAN6UL66_9PEZI|nr:hypothetical protein BT67DRAFT_290186 [Trichocladium antarcticum]
MPSSCCPRCRLKPHHPQDTDRDPPPHTPPTHPASHFPTSPITLPLPRPQIYHHLTTSRHLPSSLSNPLPATHGNLSSPLSSKQSPAVTTPTQNCISALSAMRQNSSSAPLARSGPTDVSLRQSAAAECCVSRVMIRVEANWDGGGGPAGWGLAGVGAGAVGLSLQVEV